MRWECGCEYGTRTREGAKERIAVKDEGERGRKEGTKKCVSRASGKESVKNERDKGTVRER